MQCDYVNVLSRIANYKEVVDENDWSVPTFEEGERTEFWLDPIVDS